MVIAISKILLLLASTVCFVLSFLFDGIFYDIVALYFWAFVLTFVHEMGHVISCKIVGTCVNQVNVLGFCYCTKHGLGGNKGKVVVTNKLDFFGKVNFVSCNKNKVAFAGGVVASVVISALLITLYFVQVLSVVYFVATLIYLVVVVAPLPKSDICNLFTKRK